MNGNELKRLDGALHGVGVDTDVSVAVTSTRIEAFDERGRTKWWIPFGTEQRRNKTSVTFPTKGRALINMYRSMGSGDGWVALIDTAEGRLLWAHETPKLKNG